QGDTLFPYTTLFRSVAERGEIGSRGRAERGQRQQRVLAADVAGGPRRERASPNTTDGAVETPHTGLVGSHHVGNPDPARVVHVRSEEHTSELQSRGH